MTIEMIEVEAFNSGTQIKVIGVGGGGGNAVEHMIARAVQGVDIEAMFLQPRNGGREQAAAGGGGALQRYRRCGQAGLQRLQDAGKASAMV